jgi:hypothetical protein
VAVTLQPVLVETGTQDEEGRLVFVDGRLVAVLVLLSDAHEDVADTVPGARLRRLHAHLTFPGLGAATGWIAEQCRRRTDLADGGRSP